MGRRDSADRCARAAVTIAAGLWICGQIACGGAPRAPWPLAASAPAPDLGAHAEVHTLNQNYQRTHAQVLVRAIDRPTRANLDYAAYHANFMIADPPPEGVGAGNETIKPDGKPPFAGALAANSLTASIGKTGLTAAERAAPLALAPLAEWLASQSGKLATGIEDVVAAVREEAWGLGAGPLARQNAVLGYLHDPGAGKPVELWVKVEFAPWWHGFADLPDEDGDGYPEIYGRARPDSLSADAVAKIKSDYAGKVLDAAQVASWAHKLASYWYPSYNTDLAPVSASWPDADTDAEIRAGLGDASFAGPTVVLRGKPEGKATYNVFVVKGQGMSSTGKPETAAAALPAGKVTAAPGAIAQLIEGELAAQGKSWKGWQGKLDKFHGELRRRLRALPAAVKALPGEDGFLFFRNGLDYVTGGDLEKQPRGKNPLPVIVEWKKRLASQGVDFLFVPVPDKTEIFPDKIAPGHADLVGQVVNPYARKLLLDLARAGVETVDLWQPLLADRKLQPAAAEPLFQRQDTHWTPRGMTIAAAVIAARIKRYPWFGELAPARTYKEKNAPFKRYGDLHSRLRDADKKLYQPEELVGRQVVGADGQLYDDDPDSRIVILGDSFTGVMELTDCEHAGVSAHIARQIGAPVDLVMSYGGGPNVRHKLMRRGDAGLRSKRLVVWMMTARDLYNYWENWEPLAKR
jgi:hypothetical protein